MRLEVSSRTLRRDVERLRGYGYSVHTRPGPGGHYQLAAGQRLPPLVLDDDEAIATVAGLATLVTSTPTQAGSLGDAANRAYGKIDALMPRRLRHIVSTLRMSVETEQRAAVDVPAAVLGEIAGAIAGREVIRFEYIDSHGKTSSRRVEPHRQIYLELRWYFLGWDLVREDWRVFRIDRISELCTTGRQYASRPLPAETAVKYLRSGLGEKFNAVRITIHAPISAVADAFRHEEVLLSNVGADHTEARLALDSWQRLLPALSYLDTSFQIEAPVDMTTEITQFARRLAKAVETQT